MTFIDDEKSVEDSAPREFYEIVQSELVTYRIASGDRDITYGGNKYTASPIARTEVGLSTSNAELEVSLTLPLKHPLCQRYLALGSPPRQISVTIYQLQTRSGEANRIWSGYITSMSSNFKDLTAQFRVPQRWMRSLERRVSAISAGQMCPHILYGVDCRVDDTALKLETTVTSVNGRRIIIATVGVHLGDNAWFPFGDILHVATGERQTIFTQDGTTLEMQAPIPELKIGDAVELRPGCLHTPSDCNAKFFNMKNYGGFPDLPKVDLFIPSNRVGIYGT